MSNSDRELLQPLPEFETSMGCGASELKALLSTIADQISEADRRHAGVLSDMQERLTQLGADARAMKSLLPQELSAAVERIEDNMTMLADRMGKSSAMPAAPAFETADSEDMAAAPTATFDAPRYAAANAPAPLKSAMPATAGARTLAAVPVVDPFDIVDTSMPGDVSEPWDESSAAALARVYDDAPAEATDEAVADPVVSQPSAMDEPAPALVRDAEPVDAVASPEMPLPSAGVEHETTAHHGLDARFAEIALRLEQMLSGMNPDASLSSFNDRFGEFEHRLGTALEQVATRADIESLAILEQDIVELARRFDETHGQLARLDTIEQQLNDVAVQLSDERMERLFVQPSGAAGPDAEALADRVAEEAASRFAELSAAAASGDAGAGELRRMLEMFIDERRLGDEHTATMLDTMQQALIRVLDRMDAMEVAQFAERAAPKPREDALVHQPVPDAEDFVEPTFTAPPAAYAYYHPEAAPDMAVPAETPQLHGVADAISAEMAAAETFAQPELVAPAPEGEAARPPRNAVEKLRQDFIANARLAKEKAESEAAQELDLKAVRLATAASAPPTAAARRNAASAAMPGKTGGTRILGMSPKLMVGALVLIVVVNGALLFMSRKPSPMAVETPVAAEPQAPVADKVADPAASSPESAAADGAGEAPLGAAPAEAPASSEGASSDGPAADAPEAGSEPEPGSEADAPNGEEAIEPQQQSMILDGAIVSVPTGINLRRSELPPSGAEIVRVRHNEQVAEKSENLAAAMTGLTPAAFIPDAAPQIVGGTAAPSTAATAQPLELPPLSVGPLSLRLAAANGDASAQFEVGSRLAEGKGTDQNFKEALRWYQRSAAQGFAQSQYRLGTHFERGLGVRKDAARAEEWYHRAASGGNVKAMHNLAVIKAGQDSGAPDYAGAAEWFKAAAERNLADSQFNLAVLYENGLGVSKDRKQAYKWYALAARSGDAEAIRRRDAMKPELKAVERGEADQAVDAFTPVAVKPLANDARVAGEDWKGRQGENGKS